MDLRIFYAMHSEPGCFLPPGTGFIQKGIGFLTAKKTHKKRLTGSILSLSLLTVMACAAVAPALGVIQAYFSASSQRLVQMIISTLALLIVITNLFFPGCAGCSTSARWCCWAPLRRCAARAIGRQAVQALHIPRYDQEPIDQIVRESGFGSDYIARKSEELPGGGHWLADALTSQAEYMAQGILWDIQKQVTLKLADKGPGVIVGRCPDFVLRERSDLLRVFVYAPLAMRTERIVALYGERDDSPEKRAGQGQTPRRLLSSPHRAPLERSGTA